MEEKKVQTKHIDAPLHLQEVQTINIGQIKEGEFQFGVAQSDWQFHAYNGSSKWEGKQFSNLRAVFFSFTMNLSKFGLEKKQKLKTLKILKVKLLT